jgi:hypothetical protein
VKPGQNKVNNQSKKKKKFEINIDIQANITPLSPQGENCCKASRTNLVVKAPFRGLGVKTQ